MREVGTDLVLDIDLAGIDETVANIDGFPADLGRELGIAMGSSLQFLHGQVSDRAGVFADSGRLADSINQQIISPFPNLVGAVGTPLFYGIVMEYGRRPGKKQPPVDVMKLWVKRVLKVPEEEIDSVAFLVGRKIGTYGIEGKHYFKEGLEASEPHINSLFENAVGRATARANGRP